MTPEAVSDTTGALPEREAWRDVEGAEGPASAAWLSVSRAEMATRDLRAVAGLLGHLATSDNAPEEDEMHLLSRIAAEAAEAVAETFAAATEHLQPMARAERATAAAERRRPDPEAAEASARRMARVAVELWRERRADLRQHREAAGH